MVDILDGMDIALDIDNCQYRAVKLLELLEDCCGPLLAEPVDAADAEVLASAFRVLGDPARLKLLSLIASSPSGEACVCELIEPLGLSQPTVSHHLKVLHDAGLLGRDKRGTWVYYRVVPERMAALRDVLSPAPSPTDAAQAL